MMENINIRKVEQFDNEALARLIRDIFVEYDAPREGTVYSDPTTSDLYELFKTEGSVLWIAEINENIAGCCGVYPTQGLPEGCAELVKFYLMPTARGKNLGQALFNHSINSAREMGYSKLYLESLPQFSRAVSMYKKMGFKSLNEPLGNSGHSSCNIWMLRDL